MSADNWAACPKCANLKEEKLKKAYGKIPAEEYQELLSEAKEENNTFREDYEIGVYQGRFRINYSGGCTACKFKINFKHAEEIK